VKHFLRKLWPHIWCHYDTSSIRFPIMARHYYLHLYFDAGLVNGSSSWPRLFRIGMLYKVGLLFHLVAWYSQRRTFRLPFMWPISPVLHAGSHGGWTTYKYTDSKRYVEHDVMRYCQWIRDDVMFCLSYWCSRRCTALGLRDSVVQQEQLPQAAMEKVRVYNNKDICISHGDLCNSFNARLHALAMGLIAFST